MNPPASSDSNQLPIYNARQHRVVLDSDLAGLYGVTTGAFNQAVQRNKERFPAGFVFQLTEQELASLRSQIVILDARGRGQHRKFRPYVFTEHGAIMAAMVLRSRRAVAMSIYVVRAFVQMRERMAANAAVLARLARIDKKLLEHDAALRELVERLLPLLEPAPDGPTRPKIGFHQGNR